MSRTKRDIPVFSHPIIETHCHLDYLKDAELRQILDEAQAVGVERIVTIAVEPDNLARVRDLIEEHDIVYGTQGIHPHEADHYTANTDAELRAHGSDAKVVAIGEIGLDYYYDHSDRAKQRQVFADQLKIACELDKPVVIHTRDADEDTQAILAEYAPHLKRKGVIHSFTSGIDLAQFCLEQGFMLGFNGIITFNKAENVREVLAATPIEQLVVETDSPFLTPVPYRGQENAPKFLPFVIEKIADVKQLPVDQVLKQSYHNAQRLFGWA
ncbi:TatD family hydrolase [Saccharospirillum mangrovi]|uniref:TatD family hydrolase n=1 Tax=Saccharospirillum mangrovi TaxID=2161747 RepID=UPI000D38EF7D|nr:TatD family hydrolase [Saccharospirillum mangrovi]